MNQYYLITGMGLYVGLQCGTSTCNPLGGPTNSAMLVAGYLTPYTQGSLAQPEGFWHLVGVYAHTSCIGGLVCMRCRGGDLAYDATGGGGCIGLRLM